MLWCKTTSLWFYSADAEVAVTAADNGGRPVEVVLTYGTEIDTVDDNVIVNELLCVLSEELMVAPETVTDSYGGYCGN